MKVLTPVNTALYKPLLIMGVEKRLMIMNGLISFLLLAAGHFNLTVCILSAALFIALHSVFVQLTRYDPNIAIIFRRATRYLKQTRYPAISHPLAQFNWDAPSITKPWI